MPANLEAKIQLVEELAQKLGDAKSAIVVDYCGLNVAEITDLRREMREKEVEYKVYKNTMVRRALDKAEIVGLTEYFVGPTAIAISFVDEVTPAKILQEFSKAHKNMEIKAGYVDGKAIDVKGVEDLAKLPGRDELVAKALGGLNAPIAGFVGTLSAMTRGLVIALNQIAEKKAEAEA